MNEYKKRVIDMNRVEKLQERRMIAPFFKNKEPNKNKGELNTEVTVLPPIERSKSLTRKKTVRIFNNPTAEEKRPTPGSIKKTPYQLMLQKAEQIRINWRKKREAMDAKQSKPSPKQPKTPSIPKQNTRVDPSEVDKIKIRWRNKGATMD